MWCLLKDAIRKWLKLNDKHTILKYSASERKWNVTLTLHLKLQLLIRKAGLVSLVFSTMQKKYH